MTNYVDPAKNMYNDKKYHISLSKSLVNCSSKSLAIGSYYHYSEPFTAGELIYKNEKNMNELNFEKGQPKSGSEEAIFRVCSLVN